MIDNELKKRRAGILGCVFLCILLFLGIYATETLKKKVTSNNLVNVENPKIRVTFFDVGKGDAILIETGGHQMLIDSGYDKTAGLILDYLEKQNIRQIDYLVITHFDKDHVGGADSILTSIEVDDVLQPDYESDSDQYLEYADVMDKQGMQPYLVTETMRFSMDGVDFLVYPPQKGEYEEEDNDFSLVISMTYKSRSFLFAGDCEKERLSELMEQSEFDLAHDVLKVPHHGKKEKNSEEFLKAVTPQIAVITCAEGIPADDKICRILNELDTEVYLTSNGHVICLCDGENLMVMQE